MVRPEITLQYIDSELSVLENRLEEVRAEKPARPLFPKMESTEELRLMWRREALRDVRQVLTGERLQGNEHPNPAYLVETSEKMVYNPKYGDDRMCICGHPYYRHFDTYEDMYPVGCKYCDCYTFVEATPV